MSKLVRSQPPPRVVVMAGFTPPHAVNRGATKSISNRPLKIATRISVVRGEKRVFSGPIFAAAEQPPYNQPIKENIL